MRNLLFLLLSLAVFTLGAQTPIFLETFEDGLGVFTPVGNFRGVPDGQGTAELAIRSVSGGGAALYNDSNEGGSISTQLDLATPNGANELYLTFYTHFRVAEGELRVTVSDPLNNNEVLFDSVLVSKQAGTLSSTGQFNRFDLSRVTTQRNALELTFTATGPVNYWLIDDVGLYRELPPRTTFPLSVGRQLDELGIPYVVESGGAAVRPFEIVFNFRPNEDQGKIAKLAEFYQAVRKETCVCDRIEVWEFEGGPFFDPKTGEPLGDATEIYARTKPKDSDNDIDPDGVNYNYLQYDTLGGQPVRGVQPLTAGQIAKVAERKGNTTKIAILDTGVDYEHPLILPYLYRNDDPLNGGDDDANCVDDDIIGYNFLDNVNNTLDDNGHGTHVAGIVTQNLPVCEGCDYQIIPYKIQNSRGVGTVFAAACAVLQASVMDSASVINASWGYYGTPSSILKDAIDTAAVYGTLVAASAGNDSLQLDADPRWPGSFDLKSLITVGATAKETSLADFSNFSSEVVEILAPGVDISSAEIGGGTGLRSGTSMSTPAVAAAAAERVCRNGENPLAVIDELLTMAVKNGPNGAVLDGNILDAMVGCPTGVFDADVLELDMMLSPNPTFGDTKLRFGARVEKVTVQLIDIQGQIVRSVTIPFVDPGEAVCFTLSGLPAGIYIVSATTAGKQGTRRLVKR